ncbi:glycosyltransferase family 1 protein [Acidisphaera sp. L21]|uniref:glycosyltransferase family 4 protein n=1 Tax=Acidisphaera sp. L21 TaxID=1641851 RepID=UPI00131AF4DD|nr:glycosyltransferase family 1 protein [Acidisphaera sp. L21]
MISDAWQPQVNGVVRTLSTVMRELTAMGHAVDVIGPDRFRTLPCPTYPDIRLSLLPRRTLTQMIDSFNPDALHIATEGPLGMAARAVAIARGWHFTTAFHTRFAEYLYARTRVPTALSYAWLRRFHGAGSGVMVATQSLRTELTERGFTNVKTWTRGVDLAQFQMEPRENWLFPRPIFAYVGRVAVEKNIGAFLELDLPGSKVVVGDGPARAGLEKRYPAAHFVGMRHGASLAQAFAGSDVFVFPSLTDTFGLVMLESLACGTPVAAFPVTGPLDVLGRANPGVGAIDPDLRTAALLALDRSNRAACRAHAELFSWRACAEMFMGNLVPLTATATQRNAA